MVDVMKVMTDVHVKEHISYFAIVVKTLFMHYWCVDCIFPQLARLPVTVEYYVGVCVCVCVCVCEICAVES